MIVFWDVNKLERLLASIAGLSLFHDFMTKTSAATNWEHLSKSLSANPMFSEGIGTCQNKLVWKHCEMLICLANSSVECHIPYFYQVHFQHFQCFFPPHHPIPLHPFQTTLEFPRIPFPTLAILSWSPFLPISLFLPVQSPANGLLCCTLTPVSFPISILYMSVSFPYINPPML